MIFFVKLQENHCIHGKEVMDQIHDSPTGNCRLFPIFHPCNETQPANKNAVITLNIWRRKPKNKTKNTHFIFVPWNILLNQNSWKWIKIRIISITKPQLLKMDLCSQSSNYFYHKTSVKHTNLSLTANKLT